MDTTIVWFLALVALALVYLYDQVKKAPLIEDERFEPEEIGDLHVKAGDMLRCTESYGEFTENYNYIVRVEYGGALIVWNDETKPVLAAGLDPRKFVVEEENVDGTATKGVDNED